MVTGIYFKTILGMRGSGMLVNDPGHEWRIIGAGREFRGSLLLSSLWWYMLGI